MDFTRALCAGSETPALGRGSGFRSGLSYRDRELVAVAVRQEVSSPVTRFSIPVRISVPY